MKNERFDITINLNVYSKSVFPTLLSRATERWTFGRDRAREGVWLAGNRHLPPQPRRQQRPSDGKDAEVAQVAVAAAVRPPTRYHATVMT